MNILDRLSSHRWLRPFVDLLRQGMTPEKLALTIALGAVLGVTPVLGSTTLLCGLAAVVFRLNLPAIQLVNGLVYPLQLLLLIPFYRAGAWIFRGDASDLSLERVFQWIRGDVAQAVAALWTVTMHALVAWLAAGAVSGGILYLALLPLIRQIWRRMHHDRERAAA